MGIHLFFFLSVLAFAVLWLFTQPWKRIYFSPTILM